MAFNNKLTFLTIASVLVSLVVADVSHIVPKPEEEEEHVSAGPPNPYSFSYTAGRFPGHADRMHSESGDGTGTVHGTYSYVDPRHQVRTVEYVADENGFHPSLSHPAPAETVAVAEERERHFALFQQIAEDHASYRNDGHQAVHPHETKAVIHAKQKHFTLFEQIASDHARIAAQRAEEKAAYDAEHPNHLDEENY